MTALQRQLLGSMALQGSGAAALLLATLWLGSTLGPGPQGAFSHLKSQIEFVAALTMFGLPQALFFYLQSGRLRAAAARRWAGASALLALPLGALFVVLWPGTGESALAGAAAAALVLAVAAQVLHGQLRTQLLALPDPAWFNALTALPPLLLLVGVLLLGALGASGLLAWALLFALAYGGAAALAVWRLRQRPATPVVQPVRAAELLHYGSAAWLTAVLATAALLGMQALVEARAGAAALGQFTLAATLAQVPLTPVAYAAPLLLRRWMQQADAAGAWPAARATGLLLLLLALAAAGVALRWPDLGLGAGYGGVAWVLALMLLAAAADAVLRLLAVQAGAAGLPWRAVRAEAARAAVLLAGALWWIGSGRAAGPALAAALWALGSAAAMAVFLAEAQPWRRTPAPTSTGPLRVALLGPANSIHLQRWAQAIAARGHALCVISQHRCDLALLPESATCVWLPHGGMRGYFLNVPRLRRVLREWQPTLLHAHYASGYGSTARLAGYRPTLLSVWGSDVDEFPRRSALHAAWLRGNLRSATALAATSHAMARQLQQLVPDCAPAAITPFGVDLQQFRPREGLTPEGGLTLGIVKTLAPTYGIDLLLRAFAGLCADAAVQAAQPVLRLRVVGDGPQRAELQALAATLGIEARVQFAGPATHAQVPQWLQGMDVFVAPSRAESFGVAVVEAGACGLPAVVSDAGGLPEVVLDGQTGLVVPAGDVAALQAALRRLVLDPALRQRLGAAARAHVAATYDWERCVDRMLACYLALPRAA